MVARIRLHLVIFDLDCEELIIEMFEHFLSIQPKQKNVLSHMEAIMTTLTRKWVHCSEVALSTFI